MCLGLLGVENHDAHYITFASCTCFIISSNLFSIIRVLFNFYDHDRVAGRLASLFLRCEGCITAFAWLT